MDDLRQDRYTIVLRQEESKGEWAWVARVPELPGCAATEDSPESALAHIRESIRSHLAVKKEAGQKVPEPAAPASGRFTIRVPRWVHSELKTHADAEGVSLNQLVSSILSFWVGKENPGTKSREEASSMYAYYLHLPSPQKLQSNSLAFRTPYVTNRFGELEQVETASLTGNRRFQIGGLAEKKSVLEV